MDIREQIVDHLEAIESFGDTHSLNAAIKAWLREVEVTDTPLMTVLEQKLAQSLAVLVGQDEDAEIDTSIGFEQVAPEQYLQELDCRWKHYQQTGRAVSHDEMKAWAASLPNHP